VKPTTKYAKSGQINIAYQVIGDGPIDLVYIPGWISNIDMMWENQKLANFLISLSKFSRLVIFDKRGTGLSDRAAESSTLEERMDDIRAVMDAVGSKKAALFGHSEGGSVSALFAATYPKRTIALITFGVFAKRIYSEDYPWAPTKKERQKLYDWIEENWGGGDMDFSDIAPSMSGDQEFTDWFSKYFRSGASPGAALALTKMNTNADITQILSSIRIPALIMHRTGDIDVKIGEALYLHERISGSKFVELPGNDHIFWVGETDSMIAEISEFLTGTRIEKKHDRFLATILFTDIVESTKMLSEKGDQEWKKIINTHNKVIRAAIDKFKGKEINYTGDGFLITFDGPGRAIRCAIEIRQELKKIGLEFTAGLHTGECEMIGLQNIGGISVHLASRVENQANSGEVLITESVKNLIGGLDFKLKYIGETSMKDIPKKWKLYRIEDSIQNKMQH
jgi:pimeloyl-ACP methyl ester carboxylesterase